jgi:hypothetical protein
MSVYEYGIESGATFMSKLENADSPKFIHWNFSGYNAFAYS